MHFSDFNIDESILRAIDELNYVRPTSIQKEVIPEALLGKDILACAPTGTGKSASFLIPILQYLKDFPRRKRNGANVLILAPTRELAIQIGEHASKLAKYMRIRVEYVIGGVDYKDQQESFSDGIDILVSTPGRLMEYVRNKAFLGRTIEILVIDEADRMLDMGFIDDVGRIAEETYKRKQTMLFSATLEGKYIENFAQVLNNPIRIDVEDAPRSEKGKINQYMYYADNIEHKNMILLNLLNSETVSKSIIFVKTKEKLQELRRFLESNNVKFVYIQGELAQEKRIDAIDKFQQGIINVLLATDVASRGLDVANISHVFNYDLPFSADVYLHRIGRTARAGKKGVAINIVEAHDYPLIAKFQRYTKEDINRRVIKGLEPKTKIPVFKNKKKDKKKDKTKVKIKNRLRNQLSKGKPKKKNSI